MFIVVALSPDSLTVLQVQLEPYSVVTGMMLELSVMEPPALKELSDFKEALPLVDVWRSATTISGERCVMTCGTAVMLKWHVDSLDFLQMVRIVL